MTPHLPLFGSASQLEHLLAEWDECYDVDRLRLHLGAIEQCCACGAPVTEALKSVDALDHGLKMMRLTLSGALVRLTRKGEAQRRARAAAERWLAGRLRLGHDEAIADGVPFDPRGWFVYTLIDRSGNALYVGQSSNVLGRVGQHMTNQRFGKKIRQVRLQRCNSAGQMDELERHLIGALDPPHNVVHSPRRTRGRSDEPADG